MVYKKNERHKSEADDEMENDGQDFFADNRDRRKSPWVAIISIVVIILAVVAGGFLLGKFGGVNIPFTGNSEISDGWNAVFLNNGQVYFGKIKKMNDEEIVLRDIYYLQVVNKAATSTTAATAAQQQASQELQLVKLGNELHGPSDEMTINRSQVMITEQLKKDSQVVKAIDEYIKKQEEAAKQK